MNLISAIQKNVSSIITGIAISGAAWTAIEAAKATPKAMRILEEQNIDPKKEPKKAIKATWKCYRFSAGLFVTTSIAILGLEYLHEMDRAKLLAALAYSEAKHKEYKALEKEMFGPEYPVAMEDALKDERKAKTDIPDEPLKSGMMWCYECESEQWFQTNTEEILHAELVANKMFQNEGRVTLNQFLQLFKNATTAPYGDYRGWYTWDENGAADFNWSFYRGGAPWIDIQPQIDKDGHLIITYGMHPMDDPDCHDKEEPEQFEVKQS